MKKIFIWIAIITIFSTVFLLTNHQKLPTKDDVFNITKNQSPVIEEVYFVRKIEGEWLTIFGNNHSIMIARLEQNWLDNWEIKNDNGGKTSIAASEYPPSLNDELSWSAGSKGKTSHYFGQIINLNIKKVEVETQKNFFEDALIISSGEDRFFLTRTNRELQMPVNIRGYSETGKLIYSTSKKGKFD